jgi:dienelactone hydrolase
MLAFVVGCHAAPPVAPRPQTSVGTVTLDIVDPSRRDRIAADHPREWLVQLYYPAVATPITASYADDPALLEALVQDHYYFASDAQLRAWAHRPAIAAERAAPVSQAKLPLVTISPGLGFARLNYAELAAAIVARGYVVAVIDHPYIGYSRLPDGRMLRADREPLLASENPADALPVVREWTRDIAVTLDHLEHAAIPVALDLSRVTATGHSIGGTAAVDACEDPRVQACADFEGFLEGTNALAHGARKPTLVTYSRAKGRPATVKPGAPDPADQTLAALGAQAWLVKITGGSHTSYSDAPDVLPETLTHFGGTVMPATRSFELYSGLVDALARGALPRFLATAPEARGRHAP